MSPRPLRVCTVRDCTELTKSGMCESCRKAYRKPVDAKTHRTYDEAWQRLSRSFLRRWPHCFRCGKPAEVVDHVVSIEADPSRKYDESNLESLCRSCHGRKTVARDGGFGRYYADGHGHDG
jgi:5-methylcytosine-specific restriction protein A